MKTSNKRQNLYVYIIAFLIVAISGFVYKSVLSGRADRMLIHKESTNSSETSFSEVSISTTTEELLETTTRKISVYICGAVNNPGVYEIELNTLLYSVIDTAGGFREDAAEEYINLVYEISENVSIYIPNDSEVMNFEFENSELIRGGSDYFLWGESISSGTATNESTDSQEGLININSATREELMNLPGIGEVMAQAIIDYRNSNGSFSSIEEVMNVAGIGQSKFDRIREYICV